MSKLKTEDTLFVTRIFKSMHPYIMYMGYRKFIKNHNAMQAGKKVNRKTGEVYYLKSIKYIIYNDSVFGIVQLENNTDFYKEIGE